MTAVVHVCNICRHPLKKTGQVIVCPGCGMRYYPVELHLL